jgi:Zn-dependent M32 family carboxypeptidase
MVEKYQMINRPKNRENAADYISKFHIITHPAYYQNYMLGLIFASQLRKVINNKLGGMMSPRIGKFLISRIFKFGDSLPWQEIVRKSTGENLNPRYFNEYIKG